MNEGSFSQTEKAYAISQGPSLSYLMILYRISGLPHPKHSTLESHWEVLRDASYYISATMLCFQYSINIEYALKLSNKSLYLTYANIAPV